MGQYYYVLNIDKRQYLHPHRFGDGLKLMEFGTSGCGTMTALAILLADGNGRGGGDLDSSHPIVGSWAGDRIVIAGDYADNVSGADNWFSLACKEFEEISEQVKTAMRDDDWLNHVLNEKAEALNRPL